jgi:hypothetical protein
VGCNLLPTFDFNFAKCLTFCTSKHRHLKDTVRARAAAATGVRGVTLCAPRTQSTAREDTGLSPAKAVFGAQIVLPNEFLQNDELSVDTIFLQNDENFQLTPLSKFFPKPCMFLPFFT